MSEYPVLTLTCTKCGVEIINDTKRRGLRCSKCTSDGKKVYYQKNRAKAIAANRENYSKNKVARLAQQKKKYDSDPKMRQRHLDSAIKSKWGFSAEQYRHYYWRFYEIQDGKCAICSSEEPLVLDHSHENGRVRGLLCNMCNRGLGYLRDDKDICTKASRYLSQ